MVSMMAELKLEVGIESSRPIRSALILIWVDDADLGQGLVTSFKIHLILNIEPSGMSLVMCVL